MATRFGLSTELVMPARRGEVVGRRKNVGLRGGDITADTVT